MQVSKVGYCVRGQWRIRTLPERVDAAIARACLRRGGKNAELLGPGRGGQCRRHDGETNKETHAELHSAVLLFSLQAELPLYM